MGLGTDGVAGSNNDHDMLEEMDLASKLQKVTSGDPTALPARQVFAMATDIGARALGLDRITGSLEPGKRADMIMVRLTAARAAPMYDVYSQLVYALKGSDVSDVMVNGRVVVRDRRMLTLDAARILGKAAEYRERIVSARAGR
jgi:5-methylthioadenosine/S-adenosylhomocysteine deaminase